MANRPLRGRPGAAGATPVALTHGQPPPARSPRGRRSSPCRNYPWPPAPGEGALAPGGGPAAGGTNVTITGAHFGHGEAYRCRFGSVDVVATAADGQTIVCTTPPLPAAEAAGEG